MSATLFLMYHAILKSEEERQSLPADDRPYAITCDRWEQHLSLLHETCTVTLPEKDLTFPAPPTEQLRVVLTFDDTWAQHLDVALPLLAKYNGKAVVFITTDQVGQPGYMSWQQVRALHEAGWRIGAHGKSHAFLSDLSRKALEAELSLSKEAIENQTGSPVTWLSLPGGRSSKAVLDMAMTCGYNGVFGSVPGLWDGGLPVPRLPMQQNKPALADILNAPGPTLKGLAAQARWKGALRRCVGNRLYHRLYTWLGST